MVPASKYVEFECMSVSRSIRTTRTASPKAFAGPSRLAAGLQALQNGFLQWFCLGFRMSSSLRSRRAADRHDRVLAVWGHGQVLLASGLLAATQGTPAEAMQKRRPQIPSRGVKKGRLASWRCVPPRFETNKEELVQAAFLGAIEYF